MRTDLERRLAALETGRDEVEVVIAAAGEGPSIILVNGKPAPAGFRLPDYCEFTIVNPREPLGC
mgnify:CR=1 FL=1